MERVASDGQVFFEGGARYALARAFHASHAGAAEALPRHEARWALARILPPSRGPEIGAAYRALLGDPILVAVLADVHRMREALLDAAGRGQVLVFEQRLVGSATHREVEEGPSASAAPVAPQEDKTWIEIVLTDDADPPQPVAYARYRIDLPDQSTREGILDTYGKARLDGIDPGTCQISFPGLDGRDWK